MALCGWSGICDCGRSWLILADEDPEETGALQLVELAGGVEAFDVHARSQGEPFICSECHQPIDLPVEFPIIQFVIFADLRELKGLSIPDLLIRGSGSFGTPRLIG